MAYLIRCLACNKEFQIYKSQLGKSKYCSRLCGNRILAVRALAARRANAFARRPVLVQPEDCRHIPLSGGDYAVVDIDLYDTLSKKLWRRSDKGYAVCGPRSVRLHRNVLSLRLGRPLADDELVDHKNRDKLDCRAANLRLSTPTENMANQAARSGMKGVTYPKHLGKWLVQVSGTYIGLFATEKEAAYVYDQIALQLWADFAYLNVLDKD